MPSLSVRAVPGWSVIISSEDLSLDASTLKFHVDQTGGTAFSQDINNVELFLNISCEPFGPNGCNSLRISIEQYEAPLPTAPIQLPQNQEHYTTPMGVSIFDFDWSSIPSSANVGAFPVQPPDRTGNLDTGYCDYSGSPAVRSTFPGTEGMDEYHLRSSPHQMLSPPESSACSDILPEDKDMQSDSDSNDEKENEEYIDQGSNQGIRSFPSNREAMPTFPGIKRQKTKPPRVFMCSVPSCNVKTSRRHDLLRHEVKKHGKKSKWQCEYCQTFFSSEKTQERHICSRKMIQSNKLGGSTGCWKLPTHITDGASLLGGRRSHERMQGVSDPPIVDVDFNSAPVISATRHVNGRPSHQLSIHSAAVLGTWTVVLEFRADYNCTGHILE
ncbi:hypothetical protein GALMADRAFT_1359464 [Galerina marginata CBS 339.88]|uniref:C2H2-type domain-containing protein n=1 Tax=Galerina marginata (strain CBS 339.88) TaxID=685588 RepID=A0A067S9S5_GALM3|nr:hypothetical protein GALMADRAFT_1359464 [Galerina marginata CBS 339.88]